MLLRRVPSLALACRPRALASGADGARAVPRHGGARLARGHRRGDHRAALPLAVGRVRARHRRRSRRPRSSSATSRARPGELTRTDEDLRLLPRARRGHAARARRDDRQDPRRAARSCWWSSATRRRSHDARRAAARDMAGSPTRAGSTRRRPMERIALGASPSTCCTAACTRPRPASPEMLMELAYRLAVSEAPQIREIRERIVVLINPVAEPDGRDREVDWFYRHLKGKTDWDEPAAAARRLLGQVRPPRQQPRRHPAEARAHARHPGRLPRVASDRDARPARVGSAALDLDRHRALQRQPRPERLQRVAHDRVPRGRDAHGDAAAGRVDLGLRRGVGRRSTRTPSRRTTTASAAATRRSATPPPRRSSA